MKLGLKRGDTTFSSFNRYLLKTQWSHSAIEVQGRLYESTALKGEHDKAGVRDYELTPDIASQFAWIDLGTEGDEAALAAYELIRGHGYDFFSLISFPIPVLARDSKREYCHELSALLMGIDHKGYKTPELLLYHAVLILQRAYHARNPA
jgi:hypothetical protein